MPEVPVPPIRPSEAPPRPLVRDRIAEQLAGVRARIATRLARNAAAVVDTDGGRAGLETIAAADEPHEDVDLAVEPIEEQAADVMEGSSTEAPEHVEEPQVDKEDLSVRPKELAIDEEAEMQKIANLRRELGLPEKSTLLVEPPTEEEKREVLDAFYKRRLDVRMAGTGGFIDQNKERLQRRRDEALAEVRSDAKSGRVRELALQGLEKAGIADPKGLVTMLEERGFARSGFGELQDIVMLSKLGLTPEQLGTAFDRLQILNMNIYDTSDIRNALRNSNFKNLLPVFAQCDAVTFDSLCSDLNQYYFLNEPGQQAEVRSRLVARHPKNIQQRLNENVAFYAGVLEQGGLTDEQKQRFERQLKKSLLLKDNYWQHIDLNPSSIAEGRFSTYNNTSAQVMELAEDLSYQWLREHSTQAQDEVLRDRSDFTSDMYYDHYLNKHFGDYNIRFDEQFFENLGMGRLGKPVGQLISNGISIPHAMYKSLSKPSLYDAEGKLNNVVNTTSSPVVREWAALFQELRGMHIVDPREKINYEDMFNKRQQLADVAIVVHALSEERNFDYDRVIQVKDSGEIDIRMDILRNWISNTQLADGRDFRGSLYIFQRNSTEFGLLSDDNSIIPIENLPAFAFLARHKDEIGNYVDGFVQAPFIEALAAGELVLPDEAIYSILQNYFSPDYIKRAPLKPDTIFRFQKLISSKNLPIALETMPIEAIVNSAFLSENDRSVFLAAKQYPSFGKILFDNRDRIQEFIVNGTITPAFCGEVVRNKQIDQLILHLTDDVLDTFPDEDKGLWKSIKGCGSSEIKLVITALEEGKLSKRTATQFAQSAAFSDNKFKSTREFIYTNAGVILKDASDIQFLNRLVGDFGQKADQLIRGYYDCIEAGVISVADKGTVVEFTKEFRILSPTTLQGYKTAKEGGHAEAYIAQLKSIAERMTGGGKITEDEMARPYYQDLLRHVFVNNAGTWSSYESNDSCGDRSADVEGFVIQPRYEIDLLSQSEIRVREGEALDKETIKAVQEPFYEVAREMEELGHDKEKIAANLQGSIDNTLKMIQEQGGLVGIDLDTITTTEEKMFLMLTDSMYGSRAIEPAVVKKLLITYEFAAFEDISDYMAGTNDRVGRANNQDYALLCEVGTFYSDRIKEVNRRLVEAAYSNPKIAALMPEYFKKLAQERLASGKQDEINKLRVDKLGMSDGFVQQIGRALEKRKGKKYTPDQVRRIIGHYEDLTGGLEADKSNSSNPQTQAVYGQLQSQRTRSLEAMRVITGDELDPKDIHLGEINLQQALEAEAAFKEGVYDEEQFASYTVQKFIDLFGDERSQIDMELDKFESASGNKREVLHGYITKSKVSANARMVGGVCVSGDNPAKGAENMWDMPNYFQLVIQEPDTLQCQGLVLLHHFTVGDKRILSASFNPSSTYLYSVDEAALFGGLTGVLEQFAGDNKFDMIVVSKNKAIRTNRTGGIFESAMDARIRQVGESFTFDESQQFSHTPNYKLQEMDVIWNKAT